VFVKERSNKGYFLMIHPIFACYCYEKVRMKNWSGLFITRCPIRLSGESRKPVMPWRNSTIFLDSVFPNQARDRLRSACTE